MNCPADTSHAPPSFWASPTFGTICGLVSALGYMAANVCLRAVANLDPVWVSAMKALPMVLITAPWLVVRARRGESVLPRGRVLGALVVAGLVGQLCGNIGFQWSLSVVGLALAVPLCLATQIFSSAGLGRLFLGERIAARTVPGLVMLIAAAVVLSSGAEKAHQAVADELHTETSWMLLTCGVLAAAGSGLAYSVLGIIIRRGVTGSVSVSTTLFTICLLGVFLLGGIGWSRIGWQGISGISTRDNQVMFVAGVFNAIAFMTLAKALQLMPVIYANALGATQAGLSALAAVILFGEPFSGSVQLGVGLTVLGLVMMRGKRG